MTPLEAYQLYIGVKNHFTQEKYDYFLYRGRAGQSQSSLDRRKDKDFFHWLSKTEDPLTRLVVLFSRGGSYVRDLHDRHGDFERLADEHRKRVEGLVYWFGEDLKLVDDLWGAMRPEGGRRPRIIADMNSLKLHPVTTSALDACSECMDGWEKYDPVALPELRRRSRKLRGFIGIGDLGALRAKLFEIVEKQ
jgi:hypothetical protein